MFTRSQRQTLWLSRPIAFLERIYLHFTQPSRHLIALSTVTDLTRNKADPIAENGRLRQQLSVLHRQIKKPVFSYQSSTCGSVPFISFSSFSSLHGEWCILKSRVHQRMSG